jgi:hypothetical protein
MGTFLEVNPNHILQRGFWIHCPKTHEKLPSSFGNAELISPDRRKLFINIFSKTTWKLFINVQGILVLVLLVY